MSTAVKPEFEADDAKGTAKDINLLLADASPVPAEARHSLDRLLTSKSIDRAPRLRAVLKFMIDALVEGRAETINEQMIGEAVFHRPRGYSPGDDNIVRVTIRHLRDRIDEFYRTDGRDEPYILRIPKGKYVPTLSSLRTEESASPAVVQAPLEFSEKAPAGDAAEAGAVPVSRRFISPLSWMLVIMLGATVAVLGLHLHKQADSGPASHPDGILSLLMANGKPTTVVVTDSNLEAYRMMFRKTVPLNAYLDRSYLHSPAESPDKAVLQGAWTYVGGSGQTSMTSMIIASEIQAASGRDRISIKYPHDLSMRDIEHGNYIFLGGPWINPWEQLFESRLNFRVVPLPDKPWMSDIHNMNPPPSEPTVFAGHNEGALAISYVRFALLRGSGNDGYIVLLSGTSEEAVEAGASFLMSKPQIDTLLKTFKVDSPEQLPSIEVVIETSGLQNVPENFRVVAERIVKPQ